MISCYAYVSKTNDDPNLRRLAAFDTGAEHNIARFDAFKAALPWLMEDPAVKVGLLDEPLQMLALGARPLRVMGVVHHFPIRMKHFILRMDVLIVSHMTRDFLIGRPAMREYSMLIQEGENPIISFKVPKKDFILPLVPQTIKTTPAFRAAPDSMGLGVRFNTNNGLFAQWYTTKKRCIEVTKADLKHAFELYQKAGSGEPGPR
jgi:Aspartyl protease